MIILFKLQKGDHSIVYNGLISWRNRGKEGSYRRLASQRFLLQTSGVLLFIQIDMRRVHDQRASAILRTRRPD